MKKIFISCFQPFVSRNILNSGVLSELIDRGFQVVLFVPKAKELYFKNNFENITVVGIDQGILENRKERFFKIFSDLLLDTSTKKFHKLIDVKNDKRYFRYIVRRIITSTVAHMPGIRSLYRFLDYKYNNQLLFDNYFNLYKPDVVFATDVFGDYDVVLMKNAHYRNVKLCGMVLSWDNNTSKTLQRVIPDVQIVQNEVIKEESIYHHSVPEEKIRISGIPHYDVYRDFVPKVSRGAFMDSMRLDSSKKTILVSPAGEKFIDTDFEILKILQEASKAGYIKDTQFLVRLHPTNKTDLKDFIPDKNFVIDVPGVSINGVRTKDNELDLKSLDHLKNSIYYSDIVINTLSSIAIDAAVFNKPIITIGFNGYNKVDFYRSVELYLKEENMVKLLSIGAAPVVRGQQELINWINRYIQKPETLKKERMDLIKQQCWRLDNKSKIRIVDYLVNLL